METPDWLNDNRLWTWNNALVVGFYSLLFCMFPIISIVAFIGNTTYYGGLITGIILLYLIYELLVCSYIRVTYLNGALEFCKPLRKYSLYFERNFTVCRFSPMNGRKCTGIRSKAAQHIISEITELRLTL